MKNDGVANLLEAVVNAGQCRINEFSLGYLSN